MARQTRIEMLRSREVESTTHVAQNTDARGRGTVDCDAHRVGATTSESDSRPARVSGRVARSRHFSARLLSLAANSSRKPKPPNTNGPGSKDSARTSGRTISRRPISTTRTWTG